MDSTVCRHMPKTVSFHYLSIPTKLKTPTTLFRMAMASVPGYPRPKSMRFSVKGGDNHFVIHRPNRQTWELVLTKTLEGPQTLELEVDLVEYREHAYQASHMSKVTIFVSSYEF